MVEKFKRFMPTSDNVKNLISAFFGVRKMVFGAIVLWIVREQALLGNINGGEFVEIIRWTLITVLATNVVSKFAPNGKENS